jgi:hypothetical protein
MLREYLSGGVLVSANVACRRRERGQRGVPSTSICAQRARSHARRDWRARVTSAFGSGFLEQLPLLHQ